MNSADTNPSKTLLQSKAFGFRWDFIHPRYWGTWVMFFSLWLIHWLPRKWIMGLGSWAGDQMRKKNHKRRKIVEINLALCFPDLSATQREQRLIDHYRVFGATIVDMGTIWWGASGKLERLVKHQDIEKYRQTITDNNVILFTPHVVAIDAGGVAISKIGPVVSMMKRDKNDLITRKFYQSRTRFNDPLLLMRDQGLKHFIHGIKQGRVCYYMPDEDFGDAKYTTFAPLFGVETSTLTMLGRLCKLSKAVAVPCTTRLDISTGEYEFIISEPLQDFPSGNADKDARLMNEALEKMIALAPEQYMWTFKWFKTRPDSQVSLYDQ